jgi:hypothetical protein
MRGKILWAVFLVSLVGQSSRADESVLAGEVFATYNTFAMKQVNDEFGEVSRDVGSGFDRIESAIAGGLGARFWMTPNWLIHVAWEPLYAETHGTVATEDTTGVAVVDVRYNVDGSSIQLGVASFFPSKSAWRFGLGAGVGYYWVRGEAAIEHQTGTSTIDLESIDTVTGNAPGVHFAGLGEWTLSPGFAVTALVGYRIAKVEDTRFSGESTDPKTVTDYTGFMGRLGLAMYLPMR